MLTWILIYGAAQCTAHTAPRHRLGVTKLVREGWTLQKLSKFWRCQDWLDSHPQSWHSGGFDDKSA